MNENKNQTTEEKLPKPESLKKANKKIKVTGYAALILMFAVIVFSSFESGFRKPMK